MPEPRGLGVDLHRLAPVARAAGRGRGEALRACCSGRRSAGSVACFHAFETCPSMPPGALASIRIATAGTTASAPTSTRAGARPRRGRRAAVHVRQEADREPGDGERRRAAAAAARRSPGRRRCAAPSRALSPVRPSCANAHATSGSVGDEHAAEQRRSRAAAAARREPEREADGHRQQRAARVRPAAGDMISEAETGPGERVAARRGRSAATPSHSSGGMPSAAAGRRCSSSRTAAAAARTSRRARARPGRPSSAATSRRATTARSRSPASSALQRPGAQAAEREPAGEGGEVGERAVGLQPRVARASATSVTDSAVKTASSAKRGEHPGRRAARPACGPGAAATSAAAHSAGAGEHERDLGPGRPLELRAAARRRTRRRRSRPRRRRRAAVPLPPGTGQREARDRRASPRRGADVGPTCRVTAMTRRRRSAGRSAATSAHRRAGPARRSVVAGRPLRPTVAASTAIRRGRCTASSALIARRSSAAPTAAAVLRRHWGRSRRLDRVATVGSLSAASGVAAGVAAGAGRRRRRRWCSLASPPLPLPPPPPPRVVDAALGRDRAAAGRHGSRSTRRVGRQLAARVAQLRRRVVALEDAVVRAVAHGSRSRSAAARAAGANSSAASRARKMVRRIGEFTLAALLRLASARDMPSAQASGVYAATASRAGGAQTARAARDRRAGGERRAQRGGVARGDDEPGALVPHEAARGGSYCVCGDHGNSLVEGFVDDEPPRLEKVARGNRRYDHNVAARVEVAQFGRIASPSSSARGRAVHRPLARAFRRRPSAGEHVDALLRWRAGRRTGSGSRRGARACAGAVQNATSTLCGASKTSPFGCLVRT